LGVLAERLLVQVFVHREEFVALDLHRVVGVELFTQYKKLAGWAEFPGILRNSNAITDKNPPQSGTSKFHDCQFARRLVRHSTPINRQLLNNLLCLHSFVHY
jgi:hypothetical protein